jgi:hypothetical protein
MFSVLNRFKDLLEHISYPTSFEGWHIQGRIKNKSNQEFKFDVRPMFQMPNNQLGKKVTTVNKADKIVFETDKEWVIIDILELHEYIKKESLKVVQFEDLLNKLEWNIYISKV